MFALAAYNKNAKEIILARDEFGIKPLYYYINEVNVSIIVCSEIQPILQLIGKTAVNKKVVSEILVFGTQAGEDTIFSGVKLLEPGRVLKINLESLEIKTFKLPTLMPEELDLDYLISKSIKFCTKDTFREPSLLISDGLDSNLLLTYLPNDIRKYNVVVDNDDLGVTNQAYQRLKKIHLNDTNFKFYMSQAVRSYAQPCRMTSILMYQALSTLIERYKTHLVLAGEGADEFFWGYPRHVVLNRNSVNRLISLTEIFFQNFNDTPYEKLKSLPNVETYLKSGVTLTQLEAIALAMIDNESAQRLQMARRKLFSVIRKYKTMNGKNPSVGLNCLGKPLLISDSSLD